MNSFIFYSPILISLGVGTIISQSIEDPILNGVIFLILGFLSLLIGLLQRRNNEKQNQ